MLPAGADTLIQIAPGQTDSAAAGTSGAFRFSDRDEATELLSPTAPPPHLFTGHNLGPGRIQPEPRNAENPDWFIGTLLLAIIYFTTLRVLYGRVIRNLFAAFSNITATNQAVRDENLLMQRISVLLSVLFYFSGGLFLYKLSVYFQWENKYMGTGFQQFFLFTVMLASAYSVKLILLKLLGFALNAGKLVSYYIFNIFLVNNILGIVLLPLLCCIAFVPPPYRVYVVYFSVAVAAICWVFRMVRGIRSWVSTSGYSPYYLVLYLCAFEFAPFLVIIKLA